MSMSVSGKAWQALQSHASEMKDQHLATLFAENADRFSTFSRRLGPVLMDFSKQRLNQQTISLLAALADECDLAGAIKRLFDGELVNVTEQRAAMHWALRVPESHGASSAVLSSAVTPSTVKAVHDELAKMDVLVQKLHSGHWRGYTGKVITDVVNIGVGGSDLGPMMTCRALEDSSVVSGSHIGLHFVSSMDGSQLSHLLRQLNPESTLFIISSKSFSTIDTLTNAATARAWLARHFGDSPAMIGCHFLGVSSSAEKMSAWGIPPERQLYLWDWVGGRFSMWSTIGLPIAIRIGMEGFRQLLLGAHEMDQHFRQTAWADNIPVMMALTDIWNTNFLGINAQAILPYDGRLKYLPAYLSQLEMESNGKSVTAAGQPVEASTCPVIWGEVGPNAQHAFYQLLHQGTQPVNCEFVVPIKRYQESLHDAASAELYAQHQLSLANCFAQSRLLALGEAALPTSAQLPFYKRYHGNQPSTTFLLDEINPFAFGMLIAAYEHKVFTQASIWGINPFDQWGVEMGKKIADATLGLIASVGAAPEVPMDSSTLGLIGALSRQ